MFFSIFYRTLPFLWTHHKMFPLMHAMKTVMSQGGRLWVREDTCLHRETQIALTHNKVSYWCERPRVKSFMHLFCSNFSSNINSYKKSSFHYNILDFHLKSIKCNIPFSTITSESFYIIKRSWGLWEIIYAHLLWLTNGCTRYFVIIKGPANYPANYHVPQCCYVSLIIKL